MTAGTPEAPTRTRKSAVAVIDGPRSIRFEDLPVPRPGPNEVVIRIEGSGICGSDVAVWEGREWFDYPFAPGAPGHEGWGVVEEVGVAVTDVAPGCRVAALTHHAYGSYDVAGSNAVVALPDNVRDPFPAEAVACAMNVFARSGIGRGSNVAVVGVGFMGAILIQLATAAGARVVALSRRPFSLDVARRCGAQQAISLDAADVMGRVAEFTAGELCDVAVEAAGRQTTLDVASDLVKVRGRLVIAGYHQDSGRTVNMQSWNWRGIDVVNAHERDPAIYVEGIRRAVRAVGDGTIDLSPLVTHSFHLSELDRALDTLIQRPEGFLKAVVQT